MSKIHKMDENNVSFWCPGCDEAHRVSITGANAWQFNGDYEKPTFSPSYLTWLDPNPKADPRHDPKGFYKTGFRCHSFIKEGMIEFLSDCTHILAGKTVALTDWGETL